MFEAQSRAARGAVWLDKKLGDTSWRRNIDTDDLDLGSSCGCILGQMHGDYYLGAKELGIQPWGRFAAEHGFVLSNEDEDEEFGLDDKRVFYEELTEAWKEVLGES